MPHLELSALPPMPDSPDFDPARVESALARIASLPSRFREVLAGRTREELASTYREGGWNVGEIVHHVVDSHLHSYARCKFALCEVNPAILPYEENDWVRTQECVPEAALEDLDLLEALHRRWVRLFQGLDAGMWHRAFWHPSAGRRFTLFQQAEIYAWHGDRHLSQAVFALRQPGASLLSA